MEEFIRSFLIWFHNDPHSKGEDFYADKLTFERLKQLPDKEFVEFFNQFAREGGKIQSLGYRTAPKLIENINKHTQEFREKIIEPFSPEFDLDSWLQWSDRFLFFGKGLATIYLNRINKHKYVIVNNKSVEGLIKLGYKIPGGNLKSQYQAILMAEKSLLEKFPTLENFFRIDALMHYLIGTDEGANQFNSIMAKPYFDLVGMKTFTADFGATYNGEGLAVKWVYDTREKLEYLVTLLSKKLNRNYSINYKERPNNQAQKLKTYVLTGFSPDGISPNGELFIKLAFHSLNNSPVFDIEIDINEKIENNPYEKDREDRRVKTNSRIIVDQNFPPNWDSLLDKISDHVRKLTDEYLKIANIKDTNDPGTQLKRSLNKILYGPPGTGKTYHSINYAVSIVENKSVQDIANEERTKVKARYEEYVKEGRIAFCTFHQSLGYEDFIEGIKPVEPSSEDEQLSYAVEDGIFKRMCVNASFSFIEETTTGETGKALDFSNEYDQYIEITNEQLLKGEELKLKTISGGEVLIDSITRNNNIKIKHLKGTRDYTVSKNRLAILAQAFPELEEISNINEQFRSEIGGSNSSAYWAVLNGIREWSKRTAVINRNNKLEKKYTNEDKKRIIKTFKNNDFKKENQQSYVLIIDEINRGNVSQVFGELISLLEDDKRLGADEALKSLLPYSKEEFGVPCNLHVIGTMNTADRSIEAIDTALRRRFSFISMDPEPSKLQTTKDNIHLAEMLTLINERLSILKDKDHEIGHAWFWNVKNIDDLKTVFGEKVIPLLKEYFYNDYEKLGLVLGDAFFEQPVQVKGNAFAKFTGGNELASQYDQSWQFRLKSPEKLVLSDFLTLTPMHSLKSQNEE